MAITFFAGASCGELHGGTHAGARAAEPVAAVTQPELPPFDDATYCGSRDLEAATEATDRSIHELITCGGIQVSLAQGMIGLLLVSNDRMYDGPTREALQSLAAYLPSNPFEAVEDGVWRVRMGPRSIFDLAFYVPGTDTRIAHDPFDMESYLVGLEATYALTLEQMQNEPDRKNRWTFTWDELGPLHHLLNDGKGVPETFVLELSLIDLTRVIYGDETASWFWGETITQPHPTLGPFESLLDIEMESQIDLVDERPVTTSRGSDTATVTYLVHTPRRTVRDIAALGELDLQMADLTTVAGTRTMELDESTLRYANNRRSITGALMLQSGADEVVLDFGEEGAAYPENRWICE